MAYSSIYLSPHLDDAVMSCGGQISQMIKCGHPVLILTIMTADPPQSGLSAFARSLHERWQVAADASAVRRAEDRSACGELGADFAHWNLLDCIYRRHPDDGRPLYVSEEAIFGSLHPAEDRLVDDLARRLGTLPPAGQVIAPLGVGHHVDHLLTRAAAERCFGSERLLYYQEYPYAREDGAIEAVVGDHLQWQAKTWPLSSENQATKISAIACYRSQLSTFFANEADMANQVIGFDRQAGGERLWMRVG